MKQRTGMLSLLLFLVVLFSHLPALSQTRAAGELLTVSIRPMAMSSSERVVGFELNFTAAGVEYIRLIPMGWYVVIDNDPSWNTKIRGSIRVASAAVGWDFFRDFIVIRKFEFMDMKLSAEGVVILTEDFEKERRISLSTKDLLLRKR